jgi:hypothetical protein
MNETRGPGASSWSYIRQQQNRLAAGAPGAHVLCSLYIPIRKRTQNFHKKKDPAQCSDLGCFRWLQMRAMS